MLALDRDRCHHKILLKIYIYNIPQLKNILYPHNLQGRDIVLLPDFHQLQTVSLNHKTDHECHHILKERKREKRGQVSPASKTQ